MTGPRHRRPRCITASAYTDPTGSEDGCWEFVWRGPAPGNLSWHEPLACVVWADGAGGWAPAVDGAVPIDDQGYHLGVVHLGPDKTGPAGSHQYSARWFTGYRGPARPFRFVLSVAGEQLVSPDFA